MNVQVVATTIGPDLTFQIEHIILTHYKHDLQHYYGTTKNYNLQTNYTILVLCNMLQHSRYHLGVVVQART